MRQIVDCEHEDATRFCSRKYEGFDVFVAGCCDDEPSVVDILFLERASLDRNFFLGDELVDDRVRLRCNHAHASARENEILNFS